jgi:hypothetical protein
LVEIVESLLEQSGLVGSDCQRRLTTQLFFHELILPLVRTERPQDCLD